MQLPALDFVTKALRWPIDCRLGEFRVFCRLLPQETSSSVMIAP
jgi:hypothetical protein